MELKFEWDEEKNYINQMKHGVSFEDAANIFYAPNCIEFYDYEHSMLEDRWRVYSLYGCSVLIVTFTERNRIIRIISARKAKKEEEEEYLKWLL